MYQKNNGVDVNEGYFKSNSQLTKRQCFDYLECIIKYNDPTSSVVWGRSDPPLKKKTNKQKTLWTLLRELKKFSTFSPCKQQIFFYNPQNPPFQYLWAPFTHTQNHWIPNMMYRYIGPHFSNQAANLLQAYTTHTFLYIESKGEFYIPTNKNFK